MAIKFLLIFACFGLFCSVVWANPSKIVVRSEEGRWVTELITVAADGWPN